MFRIKCVDCEQTFSSDDKDHVVCDSCFKEMNTDEEVTLEEDTCPRCDGRGCDWCLMLEPRSFN